MAMVRFVRPWNAPSNTTMEWRPVACLASLDGQLEHLVARIGEEERLDRVGCDLGQACRQRFEQVVGVHVLLSMDEAGRLLADRLDHPWVRMTRRGRRDPGGEVEVLDAVDVDDPATVAADDPKIGGLGPDARHM